ncbi:DNA-binding transcriptional response regulator, NtrC family, contains REC, AAA-type ATPase, and a Fis-type DNA-binding domains [Solimonas aquatica]|uniref:DNA-binding transcriptional response regulator, NtrC family, contains REC, AAA-type ATPase, and a Fis-type DNA-binding domains n=2 Tax=Solimonas aquatica TaxID=489703 RepID=A0A1H9FXK5_9GAMM|nr:DNA-binding transcriptional response regulator, NtrC family, contains REC, AAA-type ATPase, and a Fis-type DNA-binding domains [Solimonas aquatica]
MPSVLVVDDEPHSVDALRRALEEDFDVYTACSVDAALSLLDQRETQTGNDAPVDVILCDQRMPGGSGIEFFKRVRQTWPDVVRVLISGYTDAEDIIAGINDAGIYQYVLKPWLPEQLLKLVGEAVEARHLQNDVRRIELELRAGSEPLRRRARQRQAEVKLHHEFSRLVRAPDSPLAEVCRLAQLVARYDLAVLLQGESGTGKELLARAIHYASPRTTGPFVMENCAALPDNLLESELFGHKRGSFTGAFQDHIGLFQRANGGTIFLDEIGDTSPTFQVKLLRVLQEGELRPVGGSQAIAVDVRVIAATHRDLEAEVRAGRFREDLYYRLAAFPLVVPALRERSMDLPVLAESILQQAAQDLAKPAKGFSEEAMACLLAYPWPGNIRELRNEIYRALTLGQELVIGAEVLSPRVLRGRLSTDSAEPVALNLPQGGSLQERLSAMEAVILKETLLRCRWNKTQAAAELGLSRVGLRQKLQRLGLERR